jgi:hypothetical protein
MNGGGHLLETNTTYPDAMLCMEMVVQLL